MPSIDAIKEQIEHQIKENNDSSSVLLNEVNPMDSKHALQAINEMKGSNSDLPAGFAQSNDFQFSDSSQTNSDNQGDVTVNIYQGDCGSDNAQYDAGKDGNSGWKSESQENEQWRDAYRQGYRDANVDEGCWNQSDQYMYMPEYPYQPGYGSYGADNPMFGSGFGAPESGMGAGVYGPGFEASMGRSPEGQINAQASVDPLEALTQEFGPLAKELMPVIEGLAPVALEMAPALLALL